MEVSTFNRGTSTFKPPFTHDGIVFTKVACVGATNYKFQVCLTNSFRDVCLVDFPFHDRLNVVLMEKAVHIDSNKILMINGGEENRSPFCVYMKTQYSYAIVLQTKLSAHLTNIYGEDGLQDVFFNWI